MTTPADRVDLPRHLRRRFFVSSPSRDLAAHRAAVIQQLRDMGQDAIVMEHMGAWDADATTASLAELAASDVYLGLLAWRYGSVPTAPAGETRSVTHIEYATARDTAKPRLLLLAAPETERQDGDGALFPAALRDPKHLPSLLALRQEWEHTRVVDYFTTPDDLARKVAAAAHRYLISELYRELLAGAGLQPPRDLPPRVPGFVGRERELAALCANLRAGQATELSAALAGLGGVGKSALASEAVRQLAAEPGAFPGGITFVRCDGRAGLEGLAWVEAQLLDAWGIALSPEQQARAATSAEANVAVEEQTLRRRLRALLQPPTASQGGEASSQAIDAPLTSGAAAALALLDNVEPGLPIDRLLDMLGGVGVTALVTARHLLTSARVQTQRLDTLASDPDAARALFQEHYAIARRDVGLPKRSPAGDDAAALDRLTSLLGYLPLAIELAAKLEGHRGLSPVEAALEFEQAQRRGDLLDNARDPAKGLGVVLDKSLTALSERQRLRFAALSLPQGPDWPRATIEVFLARLDISPPAGGADAPSVDAPLPARPEGTPVETPDETPDETALAGARGDLDALVSLSLVGMVVEPVGEGQEGQEGHDAARVRVHPLLRERAQREWEQWVARHPTFRDGGAVALLRAVRETLVPYAAQANSYTALDREELLLEGTVVTPIASDARANPDTLRLVAQTVAGLLSYLKMGGRWRLGVRFLQAQLVALRQIGDRAGEGTTLNNLGALVDDLGHKEEARRYYEQALGIAREVGNRAMEGTTLNNLGMLADDLGQPEEARRYYEQALGIRREVGDRAGEGTTLNNLGALVDALGHKEEARRYYEQALGIAREVGNRAMEGTTLNNLGMLADDLGQPEEARRYYEQALGILREVGDRAGEGTTLNNLGALADALGHKEEARRYYEQALGIHREVGNRAMEGTTLNNLGALADALGQPEEARRYYEQALGIRREVGDRAGEGTTLHNLGMLARNLGQPEEARRYYEQALGIRREVGDRAGEGTTLNNLGVLAETQGRLDAAEAYYQQSLVVSTSISAAKDMEDERRALARIAAQREEQNRTVVSLEQSASTAHPSAGAVEQETTVPARTRRRKWWPFGK